jgi:hypothetical protein
LYGLTNAVACSVSKIEFQIGTADATNSYDIGIYNSSGTLLANVGAAVYSATGDVVKSFAQGTVTIPAGIVFLGTTGNATTAQIRYQVNNQYECPPNNTTGGTTSGGALNSSLTITANVACVALAIPGVVIRN